VKDVNSEEKNNASEETAFESPVGGGGDEVNQEEEGEEDKKEEGEVTPPKNPLTVTCPTIHPMPHYASELSCSLCRTYYNTPKNQLSYAT
jgi:hypothetical protein